MGYACGVFVSPGYATICPPTGGGEFYGRSAWKKKRKEDSIPWDFPIVDTSSIREKYRKLFGLLDSKDKAKVAKIIRPYAKVKSQKEYQLEEFDFFELEKNNSAIKNLRRIFDQFLQSITIKTLQEKKRKRKEEEAVISFLLTQL